MAARATRRRHAPYALAQHRSRFHIDGCGRLAHLLRCARSIPCRRAPRTDRRRRSDEIRLATPEYRVREAIRSRSPGPEFLGAARHINGVEATPADSSLREGGIRIFIEDVNDEHCLM